jgi:hypothetical protein
MNRFLKMSIVIYMSLLMVLKEKPALNPALVIKPHNDMDGDAGSFLLPRSFRGTNPVQVPE